MKKTDLKQKLFFIMGSLFHDARNYLDRQFKQYDLSRPEWLILALLRTHQNKISQRYAKTYLGLETSYFSKVLNSLEEKGFIIRAIDPNDRRNRIISVNPKSSRQIKRIFAILYELNETIQSELTDKQIKDLHQSLAKIGKQLEKYKNE